MLKGTIIKGIGGFYYVQTANGLIECRARGRFRNEGETPMVGDMVRIKQTAEDAEKGSLEEILPRKNAFIRPPVANIDQLVVTLSVKSPMPNLRLVDRLTVAAEAMGVTPVICINKVDLDMEAAQHIASIYKTTGYQVILSSRREDLGTEALKSVLKDKITALAGNSGVGKSSIINRLHKAFGLETGKVSEKTERGRHTTRHTELFELPFGGFVFDTPGFSAYAAEDIAKEVLAGLFPDIARHEGGCRFAGCAHVAEPSCSVKEALRQGKIAPERYESYVSLYQEAQATVKY
ncbi:MAG: ribosome small subunit-dependent GTPase A [Ruminococcaceae bacterium]|nr:ribosome small subunit-dependent GTPase A [Oscillospiraceae bacterium]